MDQFPPAYSSLQDTSSPSQGSSSASGAEKNGRKRDIDERSRGDIDERKERRRAVSSLRLAARALCMMEREIVFVLQELKSASERTGSPPVKQARPNGGVQRHHGEGRNERRRDDRRPNK